MQSPALLSCLRRRRVCLKLNHGCHDVSVSVRGVAPTSVFLASSSPSPSSSARRWLHPSARPSFPSAPPKSRDRGPRSDETTQTDFDSLDVLRHTAAPATSVEACTPDGFVLNNQRSISGSGVLLVGGEAFRWRPWDEEAEEAEDDEEDGRTPDGMLVDAKGRWHVPAGVWGILELVWPKPDLLIIGTGPHVVPISPQVRRHLNGLGIRLEIQDTRNAAAQFNLLATERGSSQVAAALVPVGGRASR